MNDTYLIAAAASALAAAVVGAALLAVLMRGARLRERQVTYLSTISYCLSVLLAVASRAEQRQRRAEEAQAAPGGEECKT